MEENDETGWLIELRGDVPKWWSLDYTPEYAVVYGLRWLGWIQF